MKNRIPTLISIFGASLLVASTAWTQTQTQTQTQNPSTPSMPATQNTTGTTPLAPPSSGANSGTYNTGQGQVTISSTVPQGPSTASPPSFEQLANGKKFITKEDANAYPPLANDFLYAANNGSRISKTQYEHWVKDLN